MASAPKVGRDPAWRSARILALDMSEVPNERRWCIILHSKAGTTVRANCPVGQEWRVPVAGGHHAVAKLVGVDLRTPIRHFGAIAAYPAQVDLRHPVDCPGCSGLAPGSIAAAVQRERARAKLAKQGGVE